MGKKRRLEVADDGLVTGINVTPLVDVCLVLVIIFMVTAPLLSNPVFKVKLPVATTQDEKEEKDKVTVSLSAAGRIAVEDAEFKKLDDLSAALKEKLLYSDSKLVVLRADGEAEHGMLTELMARAKDAGALSITIATKQKKGNLAPPAASNKAG